MGVLVYALATGQLDALTRAWNLRTSSLSSVDRAEQAIGAGNTQLAMEYVRETLRAEPPDSTADYRAGNVAQRAGEDTTAVLAYARGEAADPRYVWNYIALGQLSARLGRSAPAETQLRRAVALQPAMQFLHYDLAMVELAEHKPADALHDFDAELALSHAFAPALAGRRLAAAQISHNRPSVLAPTQPPTRSAQLTASPSPSPSPSPSSSSSSSPSPSPSPTTVPTRLAAAPSQTTRIARHISSIAHAQPQAPDDPDPYLTQPPAIPAPTPTPTATPMPPNVTADARAYLLEVSRDLNFTRALPPWEPGITTAVLRQRISSAVSARTQSIEDLLRLGAGALVSGRLPLAERAFDAASGRVRADWRGPYLQALVAEASGDVARERMLLENANIRAERPETYTSLAIVDLETSGPAAALRSAKRAVELDPSYGPGRFTAGMLALIADDRNVAASNLAAVASMSGAPARTSYFFGLVSVH